MRYFIYALPFVLAACATSGPGGGNVAIETTAGGQPLPGANCVVTTNAGRWNVITPASAPVGSANGDLRVLCNKAGYRASEVVYRPSTPTNSNVGIGIGGGSGHVGVGLGFGIPIGLGGGNYPSTITVEMNPQ
ncbi:hypothetical protein Q8A64_11820 [Oxalobacteraceae bacterium R-40]|uniref:Carboxypeptidase family protein n=1 Tax=Keguizhuia sedimenti TaxID=3064264 RepID=A0ABU1BSR0_9BURK|nr:hypothetical protein [Oxalobacteraceae bacterium R-40]